MLPLIGRVIEYSFIYSVAWTFTGLFPFIYSITNGGPGYDTTTLDFLIYEKALPRAVHTRRGLRPRRHSLGHRKRFDRHPAQDIQPRERVERVKAMTIRRALRPSSILIFLLFAALSLTFVFPFYYMFINAFKTTPEYYKSGFKLPEHWNWVNFVTMISQFRIHVNLLNSLFISASSVILTSVLGLFASYVFAKRPFRGSNTLYLIIIFSMFMPNQVTLIPLYFLYSKLNLINTPFAVIICYVSAGLPASIMLLTAYFKGIPNEICESAIIDGCGFFGIVRNVIYPMGLPAIAVNATFVFLRTWNDFLTPLVLLTRKETQTVVVALSALVSRYQSDPPYQMAGLAIATIPAIVMYLFFQKYLVEGVNAGAIK